MENSLNMNIKDLIEEFKEIRYTEECLIRDDDTYEYRNKETVRLSKKLCTLMEKSGLSEQDFITLKNAFNVSTKLDEKLDTVRFFPD